MWRGSSWRYGWGTSIVLPGISLYSLASPKAWCREAVAELLGAVTPGPPPCSLALPTTSPSLELWQLYGTVAPHVPVLLPGRGLGLGGLPVHIIFPSCFCTYLLNLLICLSLTFEYLNSLSLSINFWHCCIVVVENINTNFDLHMSLCLLLLSRTLLMDLTLAWMRSLSASLIISLPFLF